MPAVLLDTIRVCTKRKSRTIKENVSGREDVSYNWNGCSKNKILFTYGFS